MTPQLAPQPIIAAPALLHNAHLTSEQMEQLLSASSSDAAVAAARAHLVFCEACAAELAALRDSLSVFRQASSAHAANQLRSLPPLSIPTRSMLFSAMQPAQWVAAAALFLAALLPLQTSLRRQALQPAPANVANVAGGIPAQPAESDEALLQDVDQEMSASVPTPMQALADPTSDGATTQSPAQTPDQTATQRKD